MKIEGLKRLGNSFLIIILFLASISCDKDLDRKFELVNAGNYYPGTDWIVDLDYKNDNMFPLLLRDNDVPQIEAMIDGSSFWLLFDYGSCCDLWVTTAIEDEKNYVYHGDIPTYWADGTVRGTVKDISLSNIEVYNQNFANIRTTLADWSIYSSTPTNGAVGLKYLQEHRFTLDYRKEKLAISEDPIDYNSLNSSNYEIVPLIHQDYHPYGIHVEGKVNGIDALIYFDTGSSHSFIDSRILNSDEIKESKGNNYYKDAAKIEIGDLGFKVSYPRTKEMDDGRNGELPVRFVAGSNLLRYFVMTVDRTGDKNTLLIHK